LADQGVFVKLAAGTTNLKTIKISDLKNIPLKTA
jgi:hypothetical protein